MTDEISHEEAVAAVAIMEALRERYRIPMEDIDILFNCMITVHVRGMQLACARAASTPSDDS